MKKLLMALFVLSIVSFGCTDKKKGEENASENTLTEEQEKEVNKLESETVEIDNIKKDIDGSSKELDELMKDIE